MACYNSGFHFEVTPQKKCCLWRGLQPGCQEYMGEAGMHAQGGPLCKFCCNKGFHGRPVGFKYTPDYDRFRVCDKFSNCTGQTTGRGDPCVTASGVR